MSTPFAVDISLSPFSPLLDSWIDENTSIEVRQGKISIRSPQFPQDKGDAHSLKSIVKLVQNLSFSPENLNPLNLIKLRSNLIELNKRITSYNKSIEGSFFRRILDFFLRFFGYQGLKCEPLQESMLRSLTFSVLDKKEQLIATLINDPTAASNDPRICDTLKKLTNNKENVTPSMLRAALTKSRNLSLCADSHTLGLDLFTTFKVALFIESNRELIQAFKVGKRAGSRINLGIGHIKLNDIQPPLIIEYDNNHQQILLVRDAFHPGSFKSGGCVIDYDKQQWLALLKVSNNPRKGLTSQSFETFTQNESNLMLNLNAPHVVKLIHSARYYSVKKGRTIFRFLMPFYNQGDLYKLIKEGKLSLKDKLMIAHDILLGIIEIHRNGILHRDIKPENIFVDRVRDEQGNFMYRAFIGDLGLSVKSDDINELMRKRCGSKSFFPLELFEGAVQSEASDLWALGLTLYHLYKATPFINEHETEADLIVTLRKLSSESPKHDEDPVLNAILGLLKPIPQERSNPELVLNVIKSKLQAI